jgi:uncharacterized protein
MAELTYVIERRLGHEVLDVFLGDVEAGAFTIDCGKADVSRIRALLGRHRDLPLDYADASVVACAERQGGRVLTYDLRHFSAVAQEGLIAIVGLEGG